MKLVSGESASPVKQGGEQKTVPPLPLLDIWDPEKLHYDFYWQDYYVENKVKKVWRADQA